ncbi:fibronectin type III domain-containing protein [Dactylosporangium sp. NPDC005555]|uniref:fibronectin type III domain-containing protein n=1 Tax=Dactylosporangium sp. NPDC005555 TaxID=3154889 RepID=UPI0033AB64A6
MTAGSLLVAQQPASAAVLGSLTAVSAAGAESLTVTVTPDVPAATDVTPAPAYIVSADGPDAGSTADQTCNVAAVAGGSCVLTGLVAGTTYTVTVDPQGATAVADATATGVTVPVLSPPTIGTPLATGVSGEVNVVWTGVANTLATIANYTATAYLGGAPTGKTCTSTTNALSNSCKISGLTNGTQYTFKVVANGANSIPNSAASSASAAVAPAVTPGAPTAVTARATGTTTATVSWTAPTAADGQAFTYTVDDKNPDGTAASATCTPVGSTTTATCTGLTLNAGIYFTVTATSSGLTSDPAQSSLIIPTTPPNAVTGVTGAVGDKQIEVSWTAPVGGPTVASYKVTALQGGVATEQTCTSPSTATKCTVTGLTNGTAYTFSVVAIGLAGYGPDSTPAVSSAVTPIEAPKPTAPVVTPPADEDVTATSATISWTPAANPTTPVLYFVATAVAKTPAAAAADDELSCTTTGNSCKITGLKANTEYDVTVMAHAANSVSVAATTSITTDAGAPGTDGAMKGPIVNNHDGLAQIFARGGDNNLYTSVQAANGTWGAWTNLSGLIYSEPVAVKNANGWLTVYAIGGDHSIWYRLQKADGSFNWWTRLGSERYASKIETAVNANGTVAVFVKGTDGNLYSNWQTDAADPSQWSGWTNLSGLIYSEPTAFTRADGIMEVFAVGGDGQVWHRVQSAPNSGTWNWWSHVS